MVASLANLGFASSRDYRFEGEALAARRSGRRLSGSAGPVDTIQFHLFVIGVEGHKPNFGAKAHLLTSFCHFGLPVLGQNLRATIGVPLNNFVSKAIVVHVKLNEGIAFFTF